MFSSHLICSVVILTMMPCVSANMGTLSKLPVGFGKETLVSVRN